MDNNQVNSWNFDPSAIGEVGVSALKPIEERMGERANHYISTAAGTEFFQKADQDYNYLRNLPDGAKFNIYEYSLVGMNATKAKDVAAKINGEVENNLLPLISKLSVDTTLAFKGESSQAAFNEYIRAVKTYIGNLITDLKAFSDKIYEVGDLYAASDKSLASQIIASSNFAGSAYQPTRAKDTAKPVISLEHDLNGDGVVDAKDAQQALNEGNQELADKINEEYGQILVGNAELESPAPSGTTGDTPETGDAPEGGYPSEGGEIPETPAEDSAADASNTGDAPEAAPAEPPVEETTDAPAEDPAEPNLDVMLGSN